MQSRDQGITWNVSFNRPQHSVDAFNGGAGANPQRFYMTIWQHLTSNSPILRSDDDAVSWHDVIPPWSFLELPSDAERTAIRGLTYDPQNPDRVYVGVNIHRFEPHAGRAVVPVQPGDGEQRRRRAGSTSGSRIRPRSRT